ncbi:MAG TPA: iron chelate uptake ABC transporter family permease subunit, partial [Candidatus Limnocylindrales bacterium]|nr:iron chelate uptake ABC transporter family permease subunit [Candidatus Limnocylindrales bacterium]
MAARQDAIGVHRLSAIRWPRRRRSIGLAGAGLVALAIAAVAAVGLGTVAVAPTDTLGILVHRLLLLDVPRTWSATAETIVWDLRLPRVLEAMVVGLGLAVAGTTFQGLLRNP